MRREIAGGGQTHTRSANVIGTQKGLRREVWMAQSRDRTETRSKMATNETSNGTPLQKLWSLQSNGANGNEEAMVWSKNRPLHTDAKTTAAATMTRMVCMCVLRGGEGDTQLADRHTDTRRKGKNQQSE